MSQAWQSLKDGVKGHVAGFQMAQQGVTNADISDQSLELLADTLKIADVDMFKLGARTEMEDAADTEGKLSANGGSSGKE